jgi:L-lactate utilization protein LutC
MTYDNIPTEEVVTKTMEALKANGFMPQYVATKEEALEVIRDLIPAGETVMSGGSTTLEEIGFIELLKSGTHPWNNLKDGIFAESDNEKQSILRNQSILASYFLGSVHAVTEAGQLVVVSGSGSQIPSYAFSSPNVIWVVGTQKITSDLNSAMARAREYVYPLEDARMKSTGALGSSLSQWLILEKNIMKSRHLHIVFVGEKLGF